MRVFCASCKFIGAETFENMVLRKISGRKREEVTADWRKLHSEDLRDLCSG